MYLSLAAVHCYAIFAAESHLGLPHKLAVTDKDVRYLIEMHWKERGILRRKLNAGAGNGI